MLVCQNSRRVPLWTVKYMPNFEAEKPGWAPPGDPSGIGRSDACGPTNKRRLEAAATDQRYLSAKIVGSIIVYPITSDSG